MHSRAVRSVPVVLLLAIIHKHPPRIRELNVKRNRKVAENCAWPEPTALARVKRICSNNNRQFKCAKFGQIKLFAWLVERNENSTHSTPSQRQQNARGCLISSAIHHTFKLALLIHLYDLIESESEIHMQTLDCKASFSVRTKVRVVKFEFVLSP